MISNKLINKNEIVFFITIIASITTSYIFDSVFINISAASYVFAAILITTNKYSSIHMMYAVGFSTFIYFPAVLNGYVYDTKFDLFFSTSIISLYFLMKTRKTNYEPPPKNNYLYFFIYIFFLFFMILASLGSASDLIPYILPPCIMFYALSLKNNKFIHNTILFLLFSLGFSIFLIFSWSGYARTVVFGNLIVATLYFIYANNLPINKLLFSTAPTLASILLTTRREFNLKNIDFQQVLNDSAFGPYRLAATFIENYKNKGMDIFGFLDQVIFSLASFIPRSVWSSKPYGFGFEYTVQNMDQYLIDSGHSIASTLFGDHIYYLGWWGLITGFLMAFSVAKLIDIFYKFKKLHGYAIIIISCNMMVFVWGGLTSFSTRIIFPLIGIFPLWIIYMLNQKLFKSASKR